MQEALKKRVMTSGTWEGQVVLLSVLPRPSLNMKQWEIDEHKIFEKRMLNKL